MRSLRLILAGASVVLSIAFPSLGNAAGSQAHAPRDMVITAVNPEPMNDARGKISYGDSCTVSFATRIEKVVDDDLRVLVRAYGKFERPPFGQCPYSTPFYVTKDEYVRMEFDYLVAIRANDEAEVKTVALEAEKNYRARGFQGDKLHTAVLLDEKVGEARSLLNRAREDVFQESTAMWEELKREGRLAAMTN